tara:strand:+ start:2029 stop:2328 length:300 start_codon:yes stop_codon:yes gene_type:complete
MWVRLPLFPLKIKKMNYKLPDIKILTQKEIEKLLPEDRWKYKADCLKAARFWLLKNNNIHLYKCVDKVESYMEIGYRQAERIKNFRNKVKKVKNELEKI